MSSKSKKLQNDITKIKEKIKCKPEVVWDDVQLLNWKAISEEKQKFYCDSLGDRSWEEYKANEVHLLKLKIGFAIFGHSAEVVDKDFEEPTISFQGPDQKKTIEQIIQAIKKISEGDNIYAAFIFVIALVNHEYAEFPIVRILNKHSNCIFFIDMLGRVYKNWNDFMNNNTFPSCLCCYPKNGLYAYNKEGKLELLFEYSPESSKLRNVLRKVDTVNSAAGIGSAAVGIAVLAVPISAPLVLGSAVAGLTSGIWLTYRTLSSLVDRKQHSQTLSLSDQSARTCWLSLAAGILGGASAGAIQYTEFIARSGQVLSKFPCLAVNSLEIGNIGISGLSIINHVISIIQKKECTLSDSTQLMLSVLFFFHASLSFKTAKNIVLDLQCKIINNIEKELNIVQQNAFLTMLHESRKNGLIQGNAEVIKSIKTIKSKEVFFQELVGITYQADNINASSSINGDGLIIINDNVKIRASDFNATAVETQLKISETSKNIASDKNQIKKFIADINPILENKKLHIRTNEICHKLEIKNLDEFCVNESKFLNVASPGEIYILYKTLNVIETSQTNISTFKKILAEVKQKAKSVPCHDLHDFIMLLQCIMKKYEEFNQAYQIVKKLIEKISRATIKREVKESLLKEDPYLFIDFHKKSTEASDEV